MDPEDRAGRWWGNQDVGKRLCVCYVLESKEWAEFTYLSYHMIREKLDTVIHPVQYSEWHVYIYM